MRKLGFVFLLLIISLNAKAGGFKNEKETKAFADSLVSQFIKNNFKLALNKSKPYWPIPAVEIDSLANKINQQWPIVKQRFGKTTGKEFVQTKRIGKSFIRYIYLHKFENHAIYWQIDFYKPRAEWKINQIIFLDNLGTLYE